MNNRLNKSLKRDKEIFDLISKVYPKSKKKYFIFNVKILKSEYLKMIKNRYISTLLNFSDKQIIEGLIEINNKYKKELNFKDKLICLMIDK
jgi:hypothetical protein